MSTCFSFCMRSRAQRSPARRSLRQEWQKAKALTNRRALYDFAFCRWFALWLLCAAVATPTSDASAAHYRTLQGSEHKHAKFFSGILEVALLVTGPLANDDHVALGITPRRTGEGKQARFRFRIKHPARGGVKAEFNLRGDLVDVLASRPGRAHGAPGKIRRRKGQIVTKTEGRKHQEPSATPLKLPPSWPKRDMENIRVGKVTGNVMHPAMEASASRTLDVPAKGVVQADMELIYEAKPEKKSRLLLRPKRKMRGQPFLDG